MDIISALTSAFSLAQAGIAAAEQYATVVPTLEQGIESVVANGKSVASDIGTLVSDLKTGKYADTETDVSRALSDFGKVTASVSTAIPAVASIVTKSPSLPAIGSIASLLESL